MTHFDTSQEPETITMETRQQRRVRLGQAAPRFLQGVFPFTGRGFFDLGPPHNSLTYTVPKGRAAEPAAAQRGRQHADCRRCPAGPGGRLCPRRRRVWGVDFEGGERTVGIHIRRLHAKMPAPVRRPVRDTLGHRLRPVAVTVC